MQLSSGNNSVYRAITKDTTDIQHVTFDYDVTAREDGSHDNWTVYDNVSGNMSMGGSMMPVYWLRFYPHTVLSMLCCMFNVLSLLAMSKIRGHRTVHHTLLLNLAVGDMFGSVLLWTYYNSPILFPRFPITRLEHCLFLQMALVAPFIMPLCTSVLALLMLALNQYVAICNPLFSATWVTRGKAGVCIALAWLTATVLSMVPALSMLFLSRFEDCTRYVHTLGETSIEVCAYGLAGLIVIIVALYGRIYYEIREYRHRTPQLSRRHGTARDSAGTSRGGDTENNYKAFVTTLLLSGTLVLLWLPYMVYHLISAHLDVHTLPDIVWQVKVYAIDFLPLLNFLTNPIIYGIRMREIREGYRRLFAAMFPGCVSDPQRNNRSSVRFTTLTTNI